MRRTLIKIVGVGIALVLVCVSLLEFRPDWVLEAATSYERGCAGLEQKSIEVGEHSVAYLEGGQGAPILLVHGFGGDKDNWTRLAGHLTEDYRVIAVDLPGFGESSRHDHLSYDILSQVERLYQIHQSLGLEAVNVAGNSRGGQISTHFAAVHPSVVNTLTIVNARGIKSPVASDFDQILETGRHPLIIGNVDDYESVFDWIFVEKPYIPDAILSHFAEKAFATHGFQEKVYSDQSARPAPLDDVLKDVSVPTLIIWGDQDRIIDPSTAEVFHQAITGSKLLMLHACGHLPQIERPSEVAAAMIEHFTAQAPR